MKKVTKSTLKALARRGKLYYRIKSSFDGMVDGFSDHASSTDFSLMTVDYLNDIWCHSNSISFDDNNKPIGLYNCCYDMELKVID